MTNPVNCGRNLHRSSYRAGTDSAQSKTQSIRRALPRTKKLLLLGSVLWLSALGLGVHAQERATLAGLTKLNGATDWPWWRGPARNGIAADQNVPTEFGPGKQMVWQADVPGRGHASPIVVGSLVCLASADEKAQTQAVMAFDRSTGKLRWLTQLNQGGFPEKNHPKNTEASPSVASNGERLFATFYHHDQVQLTALDLQGELIWQKSAGHYRPQKYEYGYAASPLIYRELVIVVGEYDGDSFLAAFRQNDGEEVWRIPRPNNITFSSPVVTQIAGRDQLLLSGADEVASYDPATGKSLWSAPGTTAATCGTMVWDGDIVFASGGYPKAETLAVRADGSAEVLWKNNQKCYEQSMIVVDGYLYGLTDNGILYCWRGTDGKEMWRKRLAGPVSASPVYAGGHIYWANEKGTLYVFRPNPAELELVAENQIGDDAFPSPAICGGQIFLRVGHDLDGRRQERLYCFGAKR